MTRVGFTGTRQGMTSSQRAAVIGLLSREGVEVAHHGGCLGADIDFDQICWDFRPRSKIVVVVHPSNLRDWQGRWHPSVDVRAEKPPLERNCDIVEETDFLIATPKETEPLRRSGTWATVRYAIGVGKPVYVVYPNGDVRSSKHEQVG